MALVLLLRGVNVGGHRAFRPTTLAGQLRHFGALNIGAAGTFLIRNPVGQRQLRHDVQQLLPFETEVMICDAREIVELVLGDPFAEYPVRSDIVRFVSVLARAPRLDPHLPLELPESGKWMLKVLERKGRILTGLYRRQMKAIGYLGKLDRVFGVPVTTRSWNTVAAIAQLLEDESGRR